MFVLGPDARRLRCGVAADEGQSVDGSTDDTVRARTVAGQIFDFNPAKRLLARLQPSG